MSGAGTIRFHDLAAKHFDTVMSDDPPQPALAEHTALFLSKQA